MRDFRIIDLKKSDIQKAVGLVRDNISQELASAADKNFNESFGDYKKDFEYLKYFGIHDASGRIIGVAGIYKLSGESIDSGMVSPDYIIKNLRDMLREPYNTFWIGWFAIDKMHQRHGIGTCAINFIKDKAKEMGSRELCVYCEDEPIKFYEKMGFKLLCRVGSQKSSDDKVNIMHCKI